MHLVTQSSPPVLKIVKPEVVGGDDTHRFPKHLHMNFQDDFAQFVQDRVTGAGWARSAGGGLVG